MQTSALEDRLQELVKVGKITGHALADRTGSVHWAFGSMAERESPATDTPGGAAGGMLQMLAAFEGPVPVTHFDVCGQRAVVVRSDDTSYFAVSRNRRLGVTVHYLASGILVVTYGRSQQAVVPEVLALLHTRTVKYVHR